MAHAAWRCPGRPPPFVVKAGAPGAERSPGLGPATPASRSVMPAPGHARTSKAGPSWSPVPPGRSGEPVALALAADNEVVAAARFKDEAARDRLEAAGIRCVSIDLAEGDVAGLPVARRLRLQLRRSQVEPVGARRRRQRRWRGLADGAPPPAPAPSCTARAPPSTSRMGHHVFARGRRAGRQPRGVAVPPHLQHLQDRGRGRRSVGLPPLRTAHHHRPTVRPLRRPGWLAGHPPRDDAQRERHPRPRPMRRASTTRCTRTTSWPCCPGWLPRPPRPGHHRQLGRGGRREHRGVVRLPRRAHRARGHVHLDHGHHRQRADRPHPHARAGRHAADRMARRVPAHGGGPAPRAAGRGRHPSAQPSPAPK